MRRLGQSFAADWLRYEAPTRQVEAKGNVQLEYGGDLIEGDHLRFNLGTERGFMEKPTFRLTPIPRDYVAPGASPRAFAIAPSGSIPGPENPPVPLQGRGHAERLLFQGPDLYRIERANYTTCGPGNDDWFIRARELDIDRTATSALPAGRASCLDQTLSTPVHFVPAARSAHTACGADRELSTPGRVTEPTTYNLAPIVTRRSIRA